MNFNNRGYQRYYGTGCSLLGCFGVLLVLGFIISGSIFFFFEYFWLILILGGVVWLFRRFLQSDDDQQNGPDNQGRYRRQSWRRDYENDDNTGYDNIDRDFEEVDEKDSEDEDDDFNDF